MYGTKPEGDSGSYGSIGSPVGGPECSSDYDGLQAQCDQAMHQLQLLKVKHSDTIIRFVFCLSALAFPKFFFYHLLFYHMFLIFFILCPNSRFSFMFETLSCLFLIDARIKNNIHIKIYIYRCKHTMKELEYYRAQHIAVMNQLEATSQDSSTLRAKYSDLVNDKQRLERDVQTLQQELSELQRIQNQEVLVSDAAGNDTMNQHYLSALRKYEAIKDEYDSLRKRYDDLIATHSAAVNKVTY
jgi:regulator of replication initiation timing